MSVDDLADMSRSVALAMVADEDVTEDEIMDEGEVVLEEGIGVVGKQFFHRSNSTVCLGKIPPSPFDPLIDVLPLAEKPQLMDSVQVQTTILYYIEKLASSLQRFFLGFRCRSCSCFPSIGQTGAVWLSDTSGVVSMALLHSHPSPHSNTTH